MSRVNVTPRPDLRVEEVVVGIDRVIPGWFVQVWNKATLDPVVDEDGLSNGRVLEIMSLYCDPDCPRNERVRNLVACDVDPWGHYLPPMRTEYDRTTDAMDDLTETLNSKAPF